MEKKNTLLAFFKPIKSAKSKEKIEEEVEPAKKNDDDVIPVEDSVCTPSAAELKKANSKESPIAESSKEKRKRKAKDDDDDKTEPRKKLKSGQSSSPATPSITGFFRKISANKEKSGEKEESKSPKEVEVIEKDTEKVVNIVDEKTENEKNKAPLENSKQKTQAESKGSQEVEENKISSNIFGKRGQRKKKEKQRHDSDASDVSLDLDNDPEFVVQDVTTKSQKSIKDAFLCMQKGPKKIADETSKESLEKASIEQTVNNDAVETEQEIPNVDSIKEKNPQNTPDVENPPNDTNDDAVKSEQQEVKADCEMKSGDNEENEIREEIKAEALTTPQIKDMRLMNMLSALSAVKDDIDENITEEEPDFTPKSKRKKKKLLPLRESGQINSAKRPQRRKSLTKESGKLDDSTPLNSKNVNLVDKENSDRKNGTLGVYTVVCKTTEGQLHLDKFVSGGVGACIFYKGKFITPNQFELAADCKGRKYKSTLSVNQSPLVKLLDAHGLEGLTRRSKKVSERSNSYDSSGRSTPVQNSRTPSRTEMGPSDVAAVSDTPKSVKTAKKKSKKTFDSNSTPKPPKKRAKHDSESSDIVLDENAPPKGDEEAQVIQESGEGDVEVAASARGRRSGRIARNQDKIEEKRREQEKIEEKIKELEKKEDELKKKGRLVFPKQPVIPEETTNQQVVDLESSNESEEESSDEENPAPTKKPTKKLASIFVTKKKIVEDPEKIAARRAFLMSSAPDQCRNTLTQPASDTQQVGHIAASFPKVSHINQSDEDPMWTLKLALKSFKHKEESIFNVNLPKFVGEFVNKEEDLNIDHANVSKLNPSQIRSCVAKLKSSSEYPINTLFRRLLQAKLLSDSKEFKETEEQDIVKPLKKRKRRSLETELNVEYRNDLVSCEAWTNKYRPRCADDMLVNRGEAIALRDWLSSWTQARADRGSQSSSATSDSEFDYGSEMSGTCALVTGPPGNGKSAAVYAIADELGLHVLELNASSCRTGKQVTSMLLEATQSQQVSANKSQPKLNFFKPTAPTPSSPSTNKSENKFRKALILFEDIDVVFDDLDTGFYGAVSKICSATKRPIVFTSSSESCAVDIVSKSIKCRFEQFRFTESLDENLVTANLHLMCLSEGLNVSLSSLKSVTKTSVSSLRQSILLTQFLASSNCLQEVETDTTEKDRIAMKKQKSANSLKSEIVDLTDEDDSTYRKFLENSSVKSRGSHRIVEYEIIPTKITSYSPTLAMVQIIQHFDYAPSERKNLFPLATDSDIDSVPGMKSVLSRSTSNILQNSDIYDTEAEVEEVGDGQCNQQKDTVEVEKEKSKSTKKSKSTPKDRKHMDSLSDYLDIRASSTMFVSHHRQEIYEEVMIKSHDKFMGNLEIDPDTLLEEGTDPHHQMSKGCESEDNEILCATLTTQMLDKRSRMDILSGTRNILRSEECRKVICREGKRGGRFYHYLAKYGFNPAPTTLATVCNTFY